MKLVIVESPTKARTINQYLGKGWQVLSSQGHVRDLPKKELGVDPDKGFAAKFVTKRSSNMAQLRKAAKRSKQIYLATDNDREGEAIAYDLYTVLNRVVKDDGAFSRPVFNEITKPVIVAALSDPSGIDVDKVQAQRARRILDRLVGYLVSPLLSKSLSGSRFQGLSAGRVQSVALRFLCDREEEIANFVPEEYWEIDVHLGDGEPFVASLTKKAGKKLVVGNRAQADEIVSQLESVPILVEKIEERQRRRQPPPPFITSTMQQRASSMLSFTPKRTMRVAQQLYEGVSLPQGNVGLITYMRTDSVRVSDKAITGARGAIEKRYGKDYLSSRARRYKNKRRSQDAHEAIRPTELGLHPQKLSGHLSSEQIKLYTLIYNRFLATQMSPAIYHQRKVSLSAGAYTLEAAGSAREFDGFLVLSPEEEHKEPQIPDWLKQGQRLELNKVDKRQKFTEPPRRYSEAGLVRLLEKKGIGRPSTYATIISVIQSRNYAVKHGGSLRPTLLGQVVVDFLREYFSETVEAEFTARMEDDLDQIQEGSQDKIAVLNEFYRPFSRRLTAVTDLLQDRDERPFKVITDISCDKCGAPMELRYWKGSNFLGCSRYPDCKNTRSLPPDFSYRYVDGFLYVKEGLEKLKREGKEVLCPSCGAPMELKNGPYGRYYRCSNPDCGKTAPVSTGILCPICKKGTLVERYSRKKRRRFYACSEYPKCRFTVSEHPVKSCPACDKGVLVRKGNKLRCTNKDCTYTEAYNGD
ncbi:MAG: type I DNA topoisomerase [Candidatus Bipolaricaulota bacterium]|nr:type I DNA topoisomerase [Candidatus Bipolaricaulota bacterium]